MDIKDFKSGTYRNSYQYKYFLPEKINHPFIWSSDRINELLEKASLKLGELNSFSKLVPSAEMFIYLHTVKEATLSSRIEGTQTKIEEALVSEEEDVDPEKRNDWREVHNYILALNNAIIDLEKVPISNRLIREAHKILLSQVRGQAKTPGEFRTSQNWIGGANLIDATFVPPSSEHVMDLMSDLEKFIHNNEIKIPHLIRIAIVHYQFETIHPFLDGNGRIGRLLITLYFVSSGVLSKPLLYLSEFFEKHKTLYYDNLTSVRTKNDLEQWIVFFLNGVVVTAESAVSTLNQMISLKARIESERISLLGKRAKHGMEFLRQLFILPIVTIKDVQRLTGLSNRAANSLVDKFVEYGILIETTGFKRNKVYSFKEYIEMFSA